jgi:hypothetical protein
MQESSVRHRSDMDHWSRIVSKSHSQFWQHATDSAAELGRASLLSSPPLHYGET